MKCLQNALAMDGPPCESAGNNVKIAGIKIEFHDTTVQTTAIPTPSTTDAVHIPGQAFSSRMNVGPMARARRTTMRAAVKGTLNCPNSRS